MTEKKDDLKEIRLEKLKKIQEMGINPYPYFFKREHYNKDITGNYDKFEGKDVSIAGRIMAVRRMGKKVFFSDLRDETGKIQLYVRIDKIGEEKFRLYELLDIGDIIGVKGEVFKTKSGEITVFVKNFELLSKTLVPLPIVKTKEEETGEKEIFDAVTDKEFRYRKRYVDLIINPEVKDIFIKRSMIIREMRNFLENKGYLEVETPILQPIYGGASAKPFTTFHNALKMKLYLRIADELYLKRLIVGGFEGVFEFCKDFRNEGLSKNHNPEFTMMEFYVAYKDYNFMMDFVEEMISGITKKVTGTYKIEFQGEEIDFTPPWRRISMYDAIKEYANFDISNKTRNEAAEFAEAINIETEKYWGKGRIAAEIYDEIVESKLINPTYIIDHPLEISPLAKKHRNNPNLVERFELIIAGKEIANAFSELNDPLDQRERFEKQMEMRSKGDEEAQVLDEDFINSLEYGMPPTAGLGVGIDRLTMILTDAASIRDVIFFPQMKPEEPKEKS